MKEPTRRAKQWLEKENLLKIEAWARDGLTDVQIAHNMGVAYSTFRIWRDDYKALSAVLKRGKEVVDIEVENKLFKNAMGFHYEEVKTYIEEVNGVEKERKEIFKRYAQPNTTAQIFWLKNRKPQQWRDRQEVEHSGGINLVDKQHLIDKYLSDDDD